VPTKNRSDVFRSKPWLLDEAPNARSAARLGMELAEYEAHWKRAGEEAAVVRERSANERAVVSAKNAIVRTRVQAARRRAEADALEAKGRGPQASGARAEASLIDVEVEQRVERLRGMTSAREFRKHMADIELRDD
jgi:hypothetical protein